MTLARTLYDDAEQVCELLCEACYNLKKKLLAAIASHTCIMFSARGVQPLA